MDFNFKELGEDYTYLSVDAERKLEDLLTWLGRAADIELQRKLFRLINQVKEDESDRWSDHMQEQSGQ